ncbi:MAG: hypothetical protein IPL23_12885 [Saprospiraceae bacterium]|nr:hypothetical protein [Saprospiraceae bacterium]
MVSEQTVGHFLEDINSEQNKNDWLYYINISQNDLKDKIFSRIISSREKTDNSIDDYFLKVQNFNQYSFNLLFDTTGFKSQLDVFIDCFNKEKITTEDVKLLIEKKLFRKSNI